MGRIMMWLIALLGASCAPQQQSAPEQASPEMRKARDPEIAVAEEFALARKTATVEAYDLFIARHPKHRLADIARAERRHLVDKAADRAD
jgi:hypothetical protein